MIHAKHFVSFHYLMFEKIAIYSGIFCERVEAIPHHVPQFPNLSILPATVVQICLPFQSRIRDLRPDRGKGLDIK